ncbi:MAG TPA: phospholipase D-like domain-containing protein [Verrucomicrobiae bacterium]
MIPIEEALAQTLADRSISGAEKRALGEILRTANLNEQQRAVVRHQAFELARKELADPRAKEICNWLEEVNKLLLPQNEPVRTVTNEVFFSPGNDCAYRIIDLLSATERTADLCVFTIADDRISSAILNAHRRRLKVRIVSDNDKSYDAGSDIEEFRRAGIPVHLDCGPDHMHHKFAVFDNRILLTGSFNWTRSASAVNQENIIVSNDMRLVEPFMKEFEALWGKMVC